MALQSGCSMFEYKRSKETQMIIDDMNTRFMVQRYKKSLQLQQQQEEKERQEQELRDKLNPIPNKRSI
jgi:hypothetical protein